MEVQEKEANVCGPYQLSTERQKARLGGEQAGERCGMKQEQGHADSRTWSLNSLILTNIFMKFIFISAPSVVSVAFYAHCV